MSIIRRVNRFYLIVINSEVDISKYTLTAPSNTYEDRYTCINYKNKRKFQKRNPKKECLRRHSRNSLAGEQVVGITGGMPVIGSS